MMRHTHTHRSEEVCTYKPTIYKNIVSFATIAKNLYPVASFAGSALDFLFSPFFLLFRGVFGPLKPPSTPKNFQNSTCYEFHIVIKF